MPRLSAASCHRWAQLHANGAAGLSGPAGEEEDSEAGEGGGSGLSFMCAAGLVAPHPDLPPDALAEGLAEAAAFARCGAARAGRGAAGLRGRHAPPRGRRGSAAPLQARATAACCLRLPALTAPPRPAPRRSDWRELRALHRNRLSGCVLDRELGDAVEALAASAAAAGAYGTGTERCGAQGKGGHRGAAGRKRAQESAAGRGTYAMCKQRRDACWAQEGGRGAFH
jgi:hypothetical protein